MTRMYIYLTEHKIKEHENQTSYWENSQNEKWNNRVGLRKENNEDNEDNSF